MPGEEDIVPLFIQISSYDICYFDDVIFIYLADGANQKAAAFCNFL